MKKFRWGWLACVTVGLLGCEGERAGEAMDATMVDGSGGTPVLDMMPDLTVGDMTSAPDLSLLDMMPDPDMALPEMALPDPDMALPDPDMALPDPDMALPDPDMALPDPDMALPDPDMALPDPDMMPPILIGYPPGPYGTAEGDVMADLSFTTPENMPFTLSDARDIDGARLILFVTVTGWCGACRAEMPPTLQMIERQADAGLVTLIDLYQNNDFGPATPADAGAWKQQYALPWVVADSEFVLEPYLRDGDRAGGRTMSLLVETETMQIVRMSRRYTPAAAEEAINQWFLAH